MRVEAGADRRGAERQRMEIVQRRRNARERVVDLRDPAANHLPERHRHRILQMRAADHDHAGVRGRLLRQRVAQRGDLGNQAVNDCFRRGHVHHDRETVVGRLTLVHVIVGMHGRMRSERLAGELIGAIGNHLVRVHVALRAGSGLEHDERKLGIEPAGDDFVRGARDQIGNLRRDQAERGVGARRGFLQESERANDGTRPDESRTADREEMARPLGLRAPQAIGRDLDRPHGVMLDSRFHGFQCSTGSKGIVPEQL